MDERLCFPYKDDAKNVSGFAENVAQIYSRMMDEVSRDIFSNRLLYSLTGDQLCLKNVLLHTAGGKRLNGLLHEEGKEFYIYGAGIRGKRLIELFPDVSWRGFIDKKKQSESYHNIEILDLDQFLSLYTPGIRIIISNMADVDEIINSLLSRGVVPKDLHALNVFDQENIRDIYFPAEGIALPVESDKGFVDIGCYDGKDSLNYLKWSHNPDAKIYAFEPDIRNYRVCEEKLGAYSNIQLFHMGLSDVEEEVSVMGEGEKSHLGMNGDVKVRTRLLDHVIRDRKIGFIKMDVEGYEEHVLLGEGDIIRSQHPVLAISIYHKRSDIWRIPELLLKYNSDYSFYMRHYSIAVGDTVLYAVNAPR